MKKQFAIFAVSVFIALMLSAKPTFALPQNIAETRPSKTCSFIVNIDIKFPQTVVVDFSKCEFEKLGSEILGNLLPDKSTNSFLYLLNTDLYNVIRSFHYGYEKFGGDLAFENKDIQRYQFMAASGAYHRELYQGDITFVNNSKIVNLEITVLFDSLMTRMLITSRVKSIK